MKKVKVKKTKIPKDDLQWALAHLRAGNTEQAEAICKNILNSDPHHCEALHMLGIIYYQRAQHELAIEYFTKSIQSNPSPADAYFNLGNAYVAKNQFIDAIACYQKALSFNPAITEAYDNLGHANMMTKQYDKAVPSYRKGIELQPNCATAYHCLGSALLEDGQIDEAIRYYREAVNLESTNPDTYNNLGALLQRRGQIDEAVAYYRKAIQYNPNSPTSYQNLGNALQEKGQYDTAIIFFQKSLLLDPNYVDAHVNRALMHLLTGNYEEGWREYEWRKKLKDFPNREFPHPMWDGSDITGKTILLHAEQGYGDTIQFIRYAPLVALRGAKVVVECLHDMASLLKSAGGVHQVIARGESLPAFDVHCPLLSLPLVFKATLGSIPADIPYLAADPSFVEKWRDTVHADGSGYKVGLVWSGNPQHVNEQKRSFPLSMFAPLAQVDGIRLYSLQKGEAAEQAEDPPHGMELTDHTEDIHDFSDTAAFIEDLDLVISVDTAVAHLAGALGKPVWTLLPFVPDWRWLLNRDDSPWYPTMRLFRPGIGTR